MEFFRNPNVNWLGWKWYFLAFSMIFSVAGIVKMSWNWEHPVGGMRSPVPLGVDFRGGTQVDVQFTNPPDIDAIRRAIEAAGVKDAVITSFGPVADHQVLISLPEETNEAALDTGRQEIESALQAHYNNYFNPNSGVKVDVVGPTVGRQLEKQATLATLYSMLGMLIYLWFRFQLIYGVAGGKPVFQLPPFHREQLPSFVKKAYEESQNGVVVVCIVPYYKSYPWFGIVYGLLRKFARSKGCSSSTASARKRTSTPGISQVHSHSTQSSPSSGPAKKGFRGHILTGQERLLSGRRCWRWLAAPPSSPRCRGEEGRYHLQEALRACGQA